MAGPSLDRRIDVRTRCRSFVAWLSAGRAPALTNSEHRMSVRIDRSDEGDFLWAVEERMDGIWLRDLRISEHQFMTCQGALSEGEKVLHSLREMP
jgi:hypothetical protein